MNISEFRALVEQRRSVRGYDESRDVPEELISMILDCARWAPSGGNGQPWEFIVVRNQENQAQDRGLLFEAVGTKTRNGSSDQGMTRFIMTRTLQGAYGRRGLGDESNS